MSTATEWEYRASEQVIDHDLRWARRRECRKSVAVTHLRQRLRTKRIAVLLFELHAVK